MKTFLDWSAYKDAGMGDAYADIPKHGDNYAKAIAACINSRQCEATGKQVMCPSYRATGNPHLSTGGRVRLLKKALSSDNFQDALFDRELAEAMALCVSCKGCKRECENNIDMPLIKAEYLAQQRAQSGSSLRSKIIAHLPRLLFHFPLLRWPIRLRNRSQLLAKLSERLLGFAARTPLPEPTPAPFTPSHSSEAKASVVEATDPRQTVVLFVDTFSRYFDPQIPAAAQQVLHNLGYRVEMLAPPNDQRPYCCGRTYLSQGMVAEARDEVSRLVDALLPHVEQGKTVVGLEASCVLGLRDDATALGLGDKVARVAANTLLFEEFLAKATKTATTHLGQHPGKIYVHGHCHQKAVGAMKSVRRVLKNIDGLEFSLLDSGCCGMAGTFALEAEHADVALKIAQESLLPALETTLDGDLIANGFSCRQQIQNLAGRKAIHLAEYLADLSRDRCVK